MSFTVEKFLRIEAFSVEDIRFLYPEREVVSAAVFDGSDLVTVTGLSTMVANDFLAIEGALYFIDSIISDTQIKLNKATGLVGNFDIYVKPNYIYKGPVEDINSELPKWVSVFVRPGPKVQRIPPAGRALISLVCEAETETEAEDELNLIAGQVWPEVYSRLELIGLEDSLRISKRNIHTGPERDEFANDKGRGRFIMRYEICY